MKIIEVKSAADWKSFHKVPHIVYKADSTWIAHIEKDIEAVFDPVKNKRYENGASVLYVAYDDKNKPVGRIAAFVDHEMNKISEVKTGGFGFFECIEDAQLAKALFAKAKEYLTQFEIDAIDGPINFGERDKFYGLQTHGFEHKLFQENYNPTYYRRYVRRLGISTISANVDFSVFSAKSGR